MAASDSNPKLPHWNIWNWPATSLQQLNKSLNQRRFLQASVADFVFPGCESYINTSLMVGDYITCFQKQDNVLALEHKTSSRDGGKN